MPPRILSIQVGRPQSYSVAGEPAKEWNSAIQKQQVAGPVWLDVTNLAGDEQADLVHHGGPDKAVLAYAYGHYERWNGEYPEFGFSPGGFGENLTIVGLDEGTVCIGDTYRIGPCELQVSQPRQPCWKLARRWQFPKLAAIVQQCGRTGWYLRVITAGLIEAEMTVDLIDRPHPDLTIAKASAIMHAKPRSAAEDLRLAACPALSTSWRTTLENRALRDQETSPDRRLYGDQRQQDASP